MCDGDGPLPLACGPKHTTQPDHEKNISHLLIEGYSTEHLISTPPNAQDYQKQGKSEELLQPRGV